MCVDICQQSLSERIVAGTVFQFETTRTFDREARMLAVSRGSQRSPLFNKSTTITIRLDVPASYFKLRPWVSSHLKSKLTNHGIWVSPQASGNYLNI